MHRVSTNHKTAENYPSDERFSVRVPGIRNASFSLIHPPEEPNLAGERQVNERIGAASAHSRGPKPMHETFIIEYVKRRKKPGIRTCIEVADLRVYMSYNRCCQYTVQKFLKGLIK
jgi:hypothetical protein